MKLDTLGRLATVLLLAGTVAVSAAGCLFLPLSGRRDGPLFLKGPIWRIELTTAH